LAGARSRANDRIEDSLDLGRHRDVMDDTDRRPVSGGYKFDLCRIRRSAASWPTLLTILLAWVTLRNGMLGGLNRKP